MWAYILIGALFLFYLLYFHFSAGGPTLTGVATVISRRMEPGGYGSRGSDSYNRFITFRFSDGSDLELCVNKEAYTVLQDGETGQLVWQRDQLRSFDSD